MLWEAPASAEWVSWVLAVSPERDALVLRRSYGLISSAPESRPRIANDLGISAERVRQIERRALSSVQDRALELGEQDGFRQFERRSWRGLTRNSGFLSNDEGTRASRSLPRPLRFLYDAQGATKEKWLSRVAAQTAHGWLDREIDPNCIHAHEDECGRLTGMMLPRPLSMPGAARESQDLAIRFIYGANSFGNYICDGKPSMICKRAIRLHVILAARSIPTEAEDLFAVYRRQDGYDQCEDRALNSALLRYPHLFLKIAGKSWVALGAAGWAPANSVKGLASGPKNSAEASIRGIARRLLQDNGPMPLAALRTRIEAEAPTVLSRDSTPSVILASHEFVRLLPGVYGRREDVLPRTVLLESPPTCLLDHQQVRKYVLARRAGEVRDTFEFWSIEAEVAMARWLQGRPAAQPLFESLLSVIEPDLWPVSGAERAEWQVRKQRSGRFQLCLRGDMTAFSIPGLERLLAAACFLSANGYLNWMAVNRICAQRIDAPSGAGIVTVMTTLGAAEASVPSPDSWQFPHRPGRGLDELRHDLSRELHASGKISWSALVGVRLLARIRSGSAGAA